MGVRALAIVTGSVLNCRSPRHRKGLSQIAAELTVVPTGSLYRHIATLTRTGVLQVVAERRVRGTVEKTYTLRMLAAQIRPDDVETMSIEDHTRAFMAYAAGLLGDFDRYLSHDPAPGRDGADYRVNAMWLADAEYADSRVARHPHTGAVEDDLAIFAGLLAERATQARTQQAALRTAIVDMRTARSLTVADDEHDPEGSTVSLDQARDAALLERTERTLAEILAAQQRLAVGTYGVCDRCGRDVPTERLQARPEARRCVRCAAS